MSLKGEDIKFGHHFSKITISYRYTVHWVIAERERETKETKMAKRAKKRNSEEEEDARSP